MGYHHAAEQQTTPTTPEGARGGGRLAATERPTRSFPGTYAVRCGVLLLLLVGIGCRPSLRGWDVARTSESARAIQGEALAFVLQRYVPRDRGRPLVGYCVAIGLRSGAELRQRTRRPRFDADRDLLEQLGRSAPFPLHPISACTRDDRGEETVRDSGGRAVSFAAEEVRWGGSDAASVLVVIREDAFSSASFSCTLRRRGGQWLVERCMS